MAEHAADRINWLLEIRREHLEWLAPIRHWQHLMIASDEDKLWVTGFEASEINSTAIKSVPVKSIWHQQGALLFQQGSALPSRKLPSLLWSPIERGLPLELPSYNHNYFGIDGQVTIGLKQAATERIAAAAILPWQALRAYIETAPAIRLKGLRWTIVNHNKALVIGTPLLPVPGNTYWQDGPFLLPAGYDFEWPALRQTIRRMIQENETDYVLWQDDKSYCCIPAQALKPLTIGSFRQSEKLRLTKINER